MSNKGKSVDTMPKSNGPVVADTVQNDTINLSESRGDVIKTDIKRDGGSNNKKKDKHKNKDEARTNNNNINANNNNNKNSSKAKSPKMNLHENGLKTRAEAAMEVATAAAAVTDENITNVDDDDEKIRAVGEELLKRLQCNGTSISIRKSTTSSDKLSPKQTTPAAAAANDDVSLENPKSQIKSKPLNSNNNINKKNNSHNNNDDNSSRAYDKNCQNQQQQQPRKTVQNVNSNSNCTDTDVMKIIQCNGTHIEPLEMRASYATVQSESMTTMNDDVNTIPSCSYQTHDIHQPSTSYASVPTKMDVANAATAPVTVPLVPKSALSVKSIKTDTVEVTFKEYENELQMPDIMRVIQRELSEPYSIYTYRYFIHNWPKLCFLAMDGGSCIGAIVCKLDIHRQMTKRGYIAMLAVDAAYRKLKVGTTLVQKAIEAMLEHNADEVVLETEITNIPALRLYENLGFVRDKRLFDYYLNGVDALRLKLWFK